jgi:hypothetical protein
MKSVRRREKGAELAGSLEFSGWSRSLSKRFPMRAGALFRQINGVVVPPAGGFWKIGTMNAVSTVPIDGGDSPRATQTVDQLKKHPRREALESP